MSAPDRGLLSLHVSQGGRPACPVHRGGDVTPCQTIAIEFAPAIASVPRAEWQRALSHSDSNVVFLTQEWQQTWWDTYGRGTLLLASARQDGHIVALAPLFAED